MLRDVRLEFAFFKPAHQFGIAARDRYPSYIEFLAERTGIKVPLNRLGILQVANGAFGAALETLLGDWRDDPAPRLASGMIGSRQVRSPTAMRKMAAC